MNLSDIKNLISEEGKVVFVENDKVVGVFLSYDEYRKMVSRNSGQNPGPKLPLFVPKEKPIEPSGSGSPVIVDNAFNDEAVDIVAENPEEPEVIVAPPVSEPVELKPDLASPGPEKELTVDDLPF